MRIKRKSLRRIAKQTLIRRTASERLLGIRALSRRTKTVAKPTLIARQIEGVIEFLVWKENVAKLTHIASPGLANG